MPAGSFIGAERDRLMLYDRYYDAIAEYHRRLAKLERVGAGPLPEVRGQESGVSGE